MSAVADTAATPARAALATCWAILNNEHDPLRGFWNDELDFPGRRLFLKGAGQPEHLEGRAWDELTSAQRNDLRATVRRWHRWFKRLTEAGV